MDVINEVKHSIDQLSKSREMMLEKYNNLSRNMATDSYNNANQKKGKSKKDEQQVTFTSEREMKKSNKTKKTLA